MPLYRKVNKSAARKAFKQHSSQYRDISPDIISSTQASECSDQSHNTHISTRKNIVKSPRAFKTPSVTGFKKPILDYLDDSDSGIIAATPEHDSSVSPRESASFDRGNIDENDAEFLRELNGTVESKQSYNKPKNNAEKECKLKKKEKKVKNKKSSLNKNKIDYSSDKENTNILKKPTIAKKASNLKKPISENSKENNQIENSSQHSHSSQSSQVLSQLYAESFQRRMAAESQEYVRKPPEGPSATQRERLEWFQRERDVGLYVHCDVIGCDKLRYLANVKDPLELGEKWYCYMNPDPKYNNCAKAEQEFNMFVLEDFIQNLYNAGSIVWARLTGYPWWPALVDDDPDIEAYYWLDDGECTIPSWYNVTFFDQKKVTRAWLKPNDIRPFERDMHCIDIQLSSPLKKIFGARLAVAKNDAIAACKMPLIERLKKFSFLARYKGKILIPRNETNDNKKDKTRKSKSNRYSENAIEASSSEDELFSWKGRKIVEEGNSEKNKKIEKTNRNKNKSRKLLSDDNIDFLSQSSSEEVTKKTKKSNFVEEKKILKRKSASTLTKFTESKKKDRKENKSDNNSNKPFKNFHRTNEDINISPLSGCSNLSVDNSLFD